MTVIQHSLDTHVSHVLKVVSAFRLSIPYFKFMNVPLFLVHSSESCTVWQWYTGKHKTFCITFIQRRTNVVDVGPTLYKCYTNVFVFAGHTGGNFKIVDLSMDCRVSVYIYTDNCYAVYYKITGHNVQQLFVPSKSSAFWHTQTWTWLTLRWTCTITPVI